MNKDSYLISGILLLVAVVSLVYPGLEAGIDFTGGTEFTVETAEPVAPTAARAALGDALGAGVEVKEFGDPTTLLVRSGAGGDAEDEHLALDEGQRQAAEAEGGHETGGAPGDDGEARDM